MNCLLLILQVCVFDPSNVFVSAAYERELTQDNRQLVGNWRFDHATGDHSGRWEFDRLAGAPDYGRVALGWDVPIARGLTLSVTLAHTSLLYEGSDRGRESAQIGFTWRPFR